MEINFALKSKNMEITVSSKFKNWIQFTSC